MTCFAQGVVDHIPPGSLLNPNQRYPEHGGCVAAPAPIASVFVGSEIDDSSMFAAAGSARTRKEIDTQFVSVCLRMSNLYEQALAEMKRVPVFERRSDTPQSGYVCERIAPSVQYPIPDALGMPLKPSVVHDSDPTGGIGIFHAKLNKTVEVP